MARTTFASRRLLHHHLLLLFTATVVTLALLCHVSHAQWDPHHVPPTQPAPLCLSQFALVNNACGNLPFEPIPPPSPDEPNPPNPPSPDEPDDGGRGGGGRRRSGHGHRRHHHRHHGGKSEEPMMDNCCRWLKEVDDVCVCDLLVRLPPFLTRPAHRYSISVGGECEVSFECPWRVVN